MCHQWFMAFYILSEQGYCDLLVTTIVSEIPPKYFVELGTSRRLPDVRVVKGLWSKLSGCATIHYNSLPGIITIPIMPLYGFYMQTGLDF